MSKTTTSFRLSKRTLEMLDYIVEDENKWLENNGCHYLKTNRTQKIETLILRAFLNLKEREEMGEP